MLKNESAFLLRKYSIGFSIYVQLPKLRAFPSVRLWVYYPHQPRHPDAALSIKCLTDAILVFAKVSFPEGKWDADAVAAHLIGYIQGIFDTWVYVYDETQALKTGDSQWGTALLPKLQLSKTSRESIEVSLRT